MKRNLSTKQISKHAKLKSFLIILIHCLVSSCQNIPVTYLSITLQAEFLLWYWHCSCIVLEQFSSDCRKTKLRWLLWPITSGAEINEPNSEHEAYTKHGKICGSTSHLVLLLLIMVLRLVRQKILHTLCRNAKPKQFQNNSHKAVKSSQLPVKITTHLVAFHAAS